jgi:hypothetical protein
MNINRPVAIMVGKVTELTSGLWGSGTYFRQYGTLTG